jgi:hypothetical protein
MTMVLDSALWLVIALFALFETWEAWRSLSALIAEDEADARASSFDFLLPETRPALSVGGNSHQRRLARRKIERAAKLGNA